MFDKSGYSPLHYAAYKNNETAVENLLSFIHEDGDHLPLSGTGECSDFVPTMSQKEKSDRAINWINLVSKGDDAFTALHFASFHGNLAMI